MKNNFAILFIVLSTIVIGTPNSEDNGFKKDVRTFISLLDYIGTDYHNAVSDGKVVNSNEYLEMSEFINRAIDLFNKVNYKIDPIEGIDISRELEKLRSLIENKSDKNEVFNIAEKIKSAILKLDLIETVPTNWPDIQNGGILFHVNCSSCHGANGNGKGILTKTLNPKPANFLNDTLMEKISPFKIYNTVKLGISGTSMAPFTQLSDKETWDLAFYVSSL
ncbi:hypothetical protein MNBD_IGNAVI01-3023, partial [hydrothermal vent metagenome]